MNLIKGKSVGALSVWKNIILIVGCFVTLLIKYYFQVTLSFKELHDSINIKPIVNLKMNPFRQKKVLQNSCSSLIICNSPDLVTEFHLWKHRIILWLLWAMISLKIRYDYVCSAAARSQSKRHITILCLIWRHTTVISKTEVLIKKIAVIIHS